MSIFFCLLLLFSAVLYRSVKTHAVWHQLPGIRSLYTGDSRKVGSLGSSQLVSGTQLF